MIDQTKKINSYLILLTAKNYNFYFCQITMNRKEKRQQKFAHVNNRRDPARDLLIQEARDTLKIIQDWSYIHPVDGSCVQLPPMPESETIPADFLLAFKPRDTPFETKIEVVRTDTLSALKGLDNPYHGCLKH